jgi:hypothetical protein
MTKHQTEILMWAALAATIVFISLYSLRHKSADLSEPTPVVVSDTTPDINDSVLRSYCVLCGIADTMLVVRLARFETGHYKSRICREQNNLFGMRYHKNMPTVASGERAGYAVYDTKLLSVVDLMLYFRKYGRSLRGYAEGEMEYKRSVMKE